MNTRRYAVLVLTVFVLVSCGQAPRRLQESGKNSSFDLAPETPYEEYVSATRKVIASTRVDLKGSDREKVVDLNAPFIMKPADAPGADGRYRKGIVLIHGLSDSPYFLRPVARYFQKRGFLVYGLLLPGHGTVPGDLLSVNYKEWIEATEYAMNRLRKQAREVYIGGFSMGGTLSVEYALRHDDVRGLVLFSPGMGLNSNIVFLTPILRHVMKWESTQPDVDYTKYQSFAMNAAAQMYRLLKRLDRLMNKEGKRLAMPVFAAQSIDDRTVNAVSTIEVFNNYFTSPLNRFILYTTEPEKDYDGGRDYIKTVNSVMPAENIVSLSHVCILMPADDPHYGKNGDYRYCHQYDIDDPRRETCQTKKDIVMGETTGENLEKYPVMARLTYNPFFDELLKEIGAFLARAE